MFRLRPLPRLSRADARLTLQVLPLVASVRWKLWRTPFPRLHTEWRARVQREWAQAAPSPALGISDSHRSPATSPAPGTSGAHLLPATSPARPADPLAAEVWECAHAVSRAARLVPRASCLTQAMTLQLVLARRGQTCSVLIGVDRATPLAPAGVASAGGVEPPSLPVTEPAAPDAGRFEAHAWVEWRGRVVLGGNIARWKPLTIFAPIGDPQATKAPVASAPVGSVAGATSSD